MSYQVILSEDSVIVRSKNGTETEVNDSNHNYEVARMAALDGDWDEFYSLAKDNENEMPSDVFAMMGIASSLPDMLNQISLMMGSEGPSIPDAINVMKGMVADGIVSAEDLGIEEKPEIGEHDLSNWNGSPIFYDNEDEAKEQARKSMGFWKFHDFGTGGGLQSKYRYATVPTGFGPTAPEGYDWVCMKRS